MTDELLFGIDLGGTKTEGVVMHADGREVARLRQPTPKGDYAATLRTIRTVLRGLEQASGQRARRFGIGIPGSVSPATGKLRNGNSTWLNGQALIVDLEAATGCRVKAVNDANCLALSEARDGAAIGCAVVFAVILGTGVGGAVVIDGRLVDGAHGIGGEWGHVPLAGEGGGAACWCGRSGCNEVYLSGPAIVGDFRRAGGCADNVETIVGLAGSGDPLAVAALARHVARLARALGAIVNLIDPDLIVFGGGVSNLPGLLEALPVHLARHVFAPPEEKAMPVLALAKHGDSSGVRGAARLWEGIDDA